MMEHIWKHVKKLKLEEEMKIECDGEFLQWALTEYIIEPRKGGGYKLC